MQIAFLIYRPFTALDLVGAHHPLAAWPDAGGSAGIDRGLALTARQFGDEVDKTIQLELECDPAPPFPGGTREISEPAIVAAATDRLTAGARRVSR